MKLSSLIKILACLPLGLMLTGCQVGNYIKQSPSASFVHPNSNVTAIGPVKYSMQGPANIMAPPMLTSEMESDLIAKALAQANGATTLTDYVLQMKITMVDLFVPIYFSTVEIQGTAAKMEVGQQILK